MGESLVRERSRVQSSLTAPFIPEKSAPCEIVKTGDDPSRRLAALENAPEERADYTNHAQPFAGDLPAVGRCRDRVAMAEALCEALGACHPDDALAICAGFLDQFRTGGPTLGDPFGTALADARFWADIAPPHELVAYGMAACERLKGAPLGLNTRKALFAALWDSFTEDDRLRFAKRIDPDGLVIRRAAR